jgi:hypothetical protein
MIAGAPLLIATGLAAAVAPAGADYRLESSDWNGLSTVAAAAAAAGCPIEARDRVEWDRLSGTDVLWFVYPRTSVDGDRLALFLDAGGRALIADDFGAADAALARLDIARRPGPVEAGHYFHDQPWLPEAVAWAETPLGRATPVLVTNHPVAFVTSAPPTWRFGAGAAAVVEGRLGRGSFVALADPSVLINNMQEIAEDRRFAEALVALHCRPRRDRILLVTGEFTESGQPMATLRGAPDARRPTPAHPGDQINTAFEDLDDLLATVGDAPPRGALLGGFGVGAALLALVLLLRAMPPRRGAYDGTWTRAARDRPRAIDRAAGPWRHFLPASVLRDEARLRVAEALGEPASVLAPDEVAAAVERRYGSDAAASARLLWFELKRIPERADPMSRRNAWVSRRQLERLHRLAVELFAALDAPKGGTR